MVQGELLEIMTDNKRRSIAKAIIYKGGSLVLLATLSWVFTQDFLKMSAITISYQAVTIVGYYIHERFWSKTNWGMSK